MEKLLRKIGAKRGTLIAGRSSRALRTMSMSITRVIGYEESRVTVTIARKGCVNHQGSNSIDLWKGGGFIPELTRSFSGLSRFSWNSSSLLSSLPVHEEHACNTTCWGWISDPPSVNSCARRAQARDGKCVTVRPRWQLVAALLELATTRRLRGPLCVVCVGFIFAPAHEFVFAHIRHHND